MKATWKINDMTSKFDPKIEKQIDKRGWTKEGIQDTINNPYQTKPTTDTRHLLDGSKMNDPATAYINKDGIFQGGELYLPISQAFNFLEDCQLSNLAIIGIEGFIFQDEEIIPQLDAIADFSSVVSSNWEKYQATCNKAAQYFLKEMSNDQRKMLFNFVVQSRSEWENQI